MANNSTFVICELLITLLYGLLTGIYFSILSFMLWPKKILLCDRFTDEDNRIRILSSRILINALAAFIYSVYVFYFDLHLFMILQFMYFFLMLQFMKMLIEKNIV